MVERTLAHTFASPLGLSLIPGGEIVLRDARTGSTRTVTLEAFELARTPVTGRTDATPRHPITWNDAVRYCNTASRAEGLAPAYAITDGGTVEWNTAADGYRLPTEAEWEWACRAGTTGPTYGPLAEIAWTAADDVAAAQAVALKTPNAFGLFDTIGNVWEWCWDYADPARYGDYRSLRGGGWADEAWSCRASVRRGSAPDAVIDDVGFRLARGAVGEPGQAQGWSADADTRRAHIAGPLPVGWTPLGRRDQAPLNRSAR
ncbi:formylglycine-generating enzyme family protein [Mycetocola zhujimingii]|uniref:formylglycine-generating enzyme family protein n=1 Tax=Mycetocola zhujimingii TaxID=2079792 RepID=UPI000D396769|nr:SUMF1/EgtB/PvdO family nonheme iron enzyme [Mycetocola zhujimingii]AWB85437.1 sulfatase [Mycetocola zhujimingii]